MSSRSTSTDELKQGSLPSKLSVPWQCYSGRSTPLSPVTVIEAKKLDNHFDFEEFGEKCDDGRSGRFREKRGSIRSSFSRESCDSAQEVLPRRSSRSKHFNTIKHINEGTELKDSSTQTESSEMPCFCTTGVRSRFPGFSHFVDDVNLMSIIRESREWRRLFSQSQSSRVFHSQNQHTCCNNHTSFPPQRITCCQHSNADVMGTCSSPLSRHGPLTSSSQLNRSYDLTL